MNTTIEFLDAVKSKTGTASDYAVANVLGVTRAAVSKWRNGHDFLGVDSAIKVAKILEIDSGIVIAAVHAERAKSDQEKAVWTSIFEKLGGLAAGVIVGLALSAPTPSQADDGVKSVYYVK